MQSESQKNKNELTEENDSTFICWYFGEKRKTLKKHAREQMDKYQKYLDLLSKK